MPNSKEAGVGGVEGEINDGLIFGCVSVEKAEAQLYKYLYSMIINDLSQLSDQELEAQFESLALRPTLFSHEAHIRLAYIHINKYGQTKAEENMCAQINRFATHHGEADKFNKTVTIAAVKAVYHFIQKSSSDNFTGFIQEFPRLITNFKDLLGSHYGFNVFADKRAKREFVEPDLEAFS